MLQENGERGYYFWNSNGNIIDDDTIKNNSLSLNVPSIQFQTSQSNNVLNSNISENYAGIIAYTSEENHFENNLVKNNMDCGITLASISNNCSLLNNTIIQNGAEGLCISDSDFTSIQANNISQNGEYGLE